MYQIWRRTRLAGDALQLIHRRIVGLALLAWAPLLALSVAEGHAWGGSVALPFLRDVETHVRLLLALPLLIVAELVVHTRMRPVVRQFLDRNVIPSEAMAQFDAALASAMRLRNSVFAEALLVISWVGGATALLAALIAVQQNDINLILAYSTLSQLGFMVMGVGLDGPRESMFHLTTHAFFKRSSRNCFS